MITTKELTCVTHVPINKWKSSWYHKKHINKYGALEEMNAWIV